MGQARSIAPLTALVLFTAWISDGSPSAWALPGSQSVRVESYFGTPSRDEERSADRSGCRSLEGELSVLEEALFADAADGRWDEFSLLGAALVASGVSDADAVGRYERRMDELSAELERSGKVTGPPRARAQAVLEFLHRRVLCGGYDLDCTDLALALDEGRFNCVSASVLFNCLAARFGLAARGLEIPGHAMSRLTLRDGPVDVETTCPGWFRLMDDPVRQAELVEQVLGFRPAEGCRRSEPREVSEVELAATIYYNRGVDLLGEGRFREALAANAKALRLDPSSTTAWGNLLATLNNWAIDLDGKGQHAEAVDLLRQGIALDPSYEIFQANYVHFHSQWAEELCRVGHFREALERIARGGQDGIGETYFSRACLDVYRHWARACLEAGQTDRALAVFDEAKGRHGSLGEVLEAEVAEVNRAASLLLGQKRFSEAVVLLDKGLARQPDAKVLIDNRRMAVMQWAQPAFEKGNYAEAIRRTTHGGVPGGLDPSLVNNVRYGYYHWILHLRTGGRHAEARQITRQAQDDPFLAGQVGGAIPGFSGE